MNFRVALNVAALMTCITVGAGFAFGGLRNLDPGLVAFSFFFAAVALFIALLDLGYELEQRSRQRYGKEPKPEDMSFIELWLMIRRKKMLRKLQE